MMKNNIVCRYAWILRWCNFYWYGVNKGVKASGVSSLLSRWRSNTILAISSRPMSLKAFVNELTAPSFLSLHMRFQYRRILYVTSDMLRPLEMASKPRPVMVLSGRSRWTAKVRPSGTSLDKLRRLFPVITFDSLSTEKYTEKCI